MRRNRFKSLWRRKKETGSNRVGSVGSYTIIDRQDEEIINN